jgi:hypothetical protein
MITSGENKIRQAIDGWKNLMFKNEKSETLYQQRIQVCGNCDHKKPLVCGLCGCPLKAKLRALDSSCPDNRW